MDVSAYFIVIVPIELEDYPKTKANVRSKFFMNILCYEDPTNPNNSISKASM